MQNFTTKLKFFVIFPQKMGENRKFHSKQCKDKRKMSYRWKNQVYFSLVTPDIFKITWFCHDILKCMQNSAAHGIFSDSGEISPESQNIPRAALFCIHFKINVQKYFFSFFTCMHLCFERIPITWNWSRNKMVLLWLNPAKTQSKT